MALRKDYTRPLDLKHGRVDMNHGAGGRASAQLIEALFARAFDNPALREGNDGAVLPAPPVAVASTRVAPSEMAPSARLIRAVPASASPPARTVPVS